MTAMVVSLAVVAKILFFLLPDAADRCLYFFASRITSEARAAAVATSVLC
jgi:hypothetical protein